MTSRPAKHDNSPGPAEATVNRIGHIYLDARHRVLHFLNARARQLYKEGVPFLPSDLRRTPVQKLSGELVQPDDLPLMRAFQDERPEEATFVLPGEHGPAQMINWTAAPMRNRKDRVVGVFASVSLSPPEPDWQALAGLAHDLRTPLQALKLLVALLENCGPADENLRGLIDRIRAASDRAMGIGLDLLEWCRGPIKGGRRAEPAWFALEPFLFAVASERMPSAQQKSLLLVTDLSVVHGWEIHADQVRLGRLLSNLLVNAIRYTPAGSVQFRAEWQGTAEGRRLSLGVVDTGAGISPEEQDSIFQPFERGRAGKDSDSGGSGLGLSVVERLVEELGLEMEVYSEFGRGSAFHLLVPMSLLRPSRGDSETTLAEHETNPGLPV
jgi:signal transduction histidine kinase